MELTVLVENTARNDACAAVHGLSLHLQTAAHRILFDFAPDGESLRKNAAALGISLAAVDLAVLSHGHIDHGGGLSAFLEENHTAAVFACPGAFDVHEMQAFGDFYPIGLPGALRGHPQMRLTGEVQWIGQDLLLFTSPAPDARSPLFNSEIYVVRNGERVHDDFRHEQSLLAVENGRSVLIGGCAHGGILRLLERAEELLGRPVDAVVSGFHLFDPPTGRTESAERLDALADALAERPTRYYTCHCTGETAFRHLRARLGAQIESVGAGSRLTI